MISMRAPLYAPRAYDEQLGRSSIASGANMASLSRPVTIERACREAESKAHPAPRQLGFPGAHLTGGTMAERAGADACQRGRAAIVRQLRRFPVALAKADTSWHSSEASSWTRRDEGWGAIGSIRESGDDRGGARGGT